MVSLIIGPMFSGKTTELLRRLTRANIAGKKTILIRPVIDTRDSITHGMVKNTGSIEILTLKTLSNHNLSTYDYIGIDEGQFFSNLSTVVHSLALENKHVIVSGLDATSERTPFEEILYLIPFCNEVIKLQAVCMKCGSDFGSFTYFKGDHKEGKILVGGKDLYEARCRKCYDEK